MSSRKYAFTLIELLVVIAIIAILAAILFPVFAQAKAAAKKSVEVSNVKQQLLGAAMYEGDNDDVCPMAAGVRPAGTWGVGVLHPVPYNSVTTSPWTTTGRPQMAQSFWANATYAYTKNFGIASVPTDLNETIQQFNPALGIDTFTPGVTPANVGLTYNGLFHTLTATSIPAPANAIEFWQDQNINVVGRGASSPAMANCVAGTNQGNVPPCMFSSGDTTQGGTFYVLNGTNPAWIFGNRMINGYADSHAKTGFVGLTIAPAQAAPSGQVNDPYGQVTATGAPGNYWNCGAGGPTDQGPTAVYPCFFRPDRTF